MAITFNSASSGNSATDPLTFSHTVNAGSNKILIVGVAMEDDGGTFPTVDSVVFNTSESLTRIDDEWYQSDENIASLWYLLNPTVTTANTVVSVTAVDLDYVMAGAITINGAKQQAPEATAKAEGVSSSPAIVNITTETANAWVIDVVSNHDNTIDMTAAGGQTERYEEAQGCRINGSTKPVAVAGATSLSWELAATRDWGIIAASFEEYVAAGGISMPLVMLQHDHFGGGVLNA